MSSKYLQAKNDWEDTFNTINDAIIIHDLDCSVIQANAAAKRLDAPFLASLAARCARLLEHHRKTMVKGNSPGTGDAAWPDTIGANEEHYDPRLEKYFHVKILPRYDKASNPCGMVQIVRDISRRRQVEEEQRSLQNQLTQAQKMEALGRFSGGIAHDFNNILTVILGYSQLMLFKMSKDDPLRPQLETISRSGEKATALIRQLLAFSRKQMLEMLPVNLNTIVDNLGKMLGRLIGEDIKLELRTTPAIGSILADAGQIEQILMNLTINARDAMRDGGSLVIETAAIDLDEKYAGSHGEVQPGRYVMVSVTDSGEGMSEEVQQKIFDPFFTTKGAGKGTGLGLAMVHGIIKQHNGHISVYSEEGQGTTFKVYFPAIQDTVQDSKVAKPRAMPPGTETVLLAEDEPSIRRLVSDTLLALGYRLLEAANGEEALHVAKKYPETIDLLLTDVIMPGMNGRELAEEISALKPGLSVVFMSGYTDDILSRHGVCEHGFNYISKPLVLTELACKLREVLDAAAKQLTH